MQPRYSPTAIGAPSDFPVAAGDGHIPAAASQSAVLPPQPLDPQKFKIRLCTNFMNGSGCAYGARCAFAHGHSELRGPASPSSSGPTTLPPPPYGFDSLAYSSPPPPPPAYPAPVLPSAIRPPSYTEACKSLPTSPHHSRPTSPKGSRPASRATSPTRRATEGSAAAEAVATGKYFRHDPYSPHSPKVYSNNALDEMEGAQPEDAS